MAKLEILTFPDARLREISKAVDKVTPDLQQLVKDMIETMYEANGIGLAAPQVNRQIRLLVIDTRPRKTDRYEENIMTELEQKVQYPLVLFNPKVISGEGKTTYDEGCLSVPGYFETVERFNYVEVEALNEQGEKIIIKTDGLLAICIQHEIDHLEGKLFIDRISFLKSNKIKNKIKKSGYPSRDSEPEESSAKAPSTKSSSKSKSKEKMEI